MKLGFRYLFCAVNRFRFQRVDNISWKVKLLNYGNCYVHTKLELPSASNDLITSDNSLQPDSDVDASALSIEVKESEDVLSECRDDVSMYAPYFAPSYNLAAYVNKSPTLQELVKLGVDLHRLESRTGIIEAVLKLDFEKDIKKYLVFLNDLNIPPDQFGSILTRCPTLLLQDLDNLKIRLNYLESKKFSPEDIIRIFTTNPTWFTWRTQDIDYRLGFLQKEFRLTGDEVRYVSVKRPKLVTFKLQEIKSAIFSVREEMGFTRDESKMLLLNKPKIYTTAKSQLVSRFDYIHNVMKIPHSLIVQQPDGLLHRKFRLEARHGFLKSLSRDQYDPTKPNYVSMVALLSGTDSDFASNIARTSVQIYNRFLKTL